MLAVGQAGVLHARGAEEMDEMQMQMQMDMDLDMDMGSGSGGSSTGGTVC